MSLFELEEGRVAQVESLLDATNEKINSHARSAVDQVTGLAGGGWAGTACNTANAVQTENFLPAMQRIHDELDFLRDNLTTSRKNFAAQEETNAVDLQGCNFDRLAA